MLLDPGRKHVRVVNTRIKGCHPIDSLRRDDLQCGVCTPKGSSSFARISQVEPNTLHNYIIPYN
jgi:hypothetical protein